MSERSSWIFFLAHAGADTAEAERLYDILSREYAVFLDKRTLRLGDDWDTEIARAQRSARVTVVLISERYEYAYYLREEVASAIHLARSSPEDHRVVPVFLDGWPSSASGIPYGLRLKHGIDAKAAGGMQGVAADLRKLVSQLKPSPMPQITAPSVAHDRTEVYNNLCQLLPAQFEQLLFYLNAPTAQLVPQSAPLAARAVDLILLMEQHGPTGLATLVDKLRRVAPYLA
jgi:hypothetical protein